MNDPGTFDTVEEWQNQPQTCCAHCGHTLGHPLPTYCTRCSRPPEAKR